MWPKVFLGSWIFFIITTLILIASNRYIHINVELVIPHLNDWWMTWLCVNIIFYFIAIGMSITESGNISTHKKTIIITTKRL